MPMMDYTLILEKDSTGITATRNSTNVINLTALTASQQVGYVYINVVCGTALTGDTTPTLTIALMSHNTTSIESGTIHLQTQAFGIDTTNVTTAGQVLLSAQIPLELLEQYVGLRFTEVNNITGGGVDAWFGMEPVNESLTIQASMPIPSPA